MINNGHDAAVRAAGETDILHVCFLGGGFCREKNEDYVCAGDWRRVLCCCDEIRALASYKTQVLIFYSELGKRTLRSR